MRLRDEKQNYMLVNQAIGVIGSIEMRKLHSASVFPRLSQARVLRDIIERSCDTVYGREHHFDEILRAKTPGEMYELFTRYNKPTEFEDYRPYVDRMMNGEADILFKGKPVLYATTSGSTGKPKYVPMSATYMANVYGRMTRLWLYTMMRNRRKVFSGKMLTVVGKQVEGKAPDGTAFGSVSSFTKNDAPQMIKNMYPVPSQVYNIDDYAARNYTLMRFALEHNITTWIAPNPSTVLELQNNVDKWLDEFIEDIGNGTLTDKVPVPDDVRASLKPFLKSNPERAYELRALQSQYDRVLPRHYWPNLQNLLTWRCGNTQIYLRKMEGFFPDRMFQQELGYFSTECRAGLVLDASIETVLMPHMHFFEFKREKDLDDPDAPFYQIFELKEGERYCPYVTTFNGFFRYNMNDIVQVGSAFQNTPRVHMVQKVNGIVSITGEKLYEDQFITAVAQAQASTGLTLSYYTGYVNLQESRYDWYFEFSDRKVKQKKAEEFAAVVDENLKKLNIEYESKRNSFRLKDPAVYLLQVNAFDKFKEYILNRTHRDASRFKPNVLAQNEDNHAVIHQFRMAIRERTSKIKK